MKITNFSFATLHSLPTDQMVHSCKYISNVVKIVLFLPQESTIKDVTSILEHFCVGMQIPYSKLFLSDTISYSI